MLQYCADAKSEVVRSWFGIALWEMLEECGRFFEDRDFELAAYLIENGADLRAYNNDYQAPKTTALQLVCRKGYGKQVITCCKALLDHGADVNGSLAPKTGTPLEYACKRGFTEMAQLLLERGAVVNRVPPTGHGRFESALELSLRYANGGCGNPGNERIDMSPLSMVELLLAYGAEVNGVFVRRRLGQGGSECSSEFELGSESESWSDSEPRYDGEPWYDGWAGDHEVTPLMFASHWCLPSVTALLLKHGADPNPKDAFKSPLQLACQRKDPSVEDVKALLDAGADVNIGEQTDCATPLHLVVTESGQLEVAALLIEKGANVNATSSGGKYASAVYTAAFRQDVDLVDLLLANGADASEAELGHWWP
jgi:ankyrin repeat protein